MFRRHPVRFFANEKCDGRNAGGSDATAAFGRIRKGGGVRGEAAPSDGATEAELIELLGVVGDDTAREDVMLPRVCGSFEALQLTQDFEGAAFADELRPGGEVLPTEQPAHALRGSDRLNFAAEPAESEAMEIHDTVASRVARRDSQEPKTKADADAGTGRYGIKAARGRNEMCCLRSNLLKSWFAIAS